MKNREIVTNRSGTFTKLPRVIAVKPLEGFKVHLTFSDHVEKVIDLEPYLIGPIFEPIRNNQEYFRTIHVDVDTVGWSNGADIAPETLYYDGDPPWMALEGQARHTPKDRTKRRAQTRRARARA